MLFLLQQYQEVILILLKKLLKKSLLYIGIFYPLGEPILLHLQQPRLVNNPSKLMKKRIICKNKHKGEHI